MLHTFYGLFLIFIRSRTLKTKNKFTKKVFFQYWFLISHVSKFSHHVCLKLFPAFLLDLQFSLGEGGKEKVFPFNKTLLFSLCRRDVQLRGRQAPSLDQLGKLRGSSCASRKAVSILACLAHTTRTSHVWTYLWPTTVQSKLLATFLFYIFVWFKKIT